MSNIMRVSQSICHGRDASDMAEDLPHILRVQAAVENARAAVEDARRHVHSERGRNTLAELDIGLVEVCADSCIGSTASLCLEAAQLVGTVNMRVVR